MPRIKKDLKTLTMVNIHQVNGDFYAVEFLKNADFRWVESLFLRAKQLGKSEFDYHGQMYQLIKNRNLTYSVEQIPEKIMYVESL
ncbi:MAG: hypothetical protein V1907_00975 [Candidatus Kerfeldbacteria bacterium]